MTLTGTNDLGAITAIVITTDSTGAYDFTNLRPGTYTLTETQPAGYLQGTNTVGTVNGVTTGQLGPGVDVISNIVLTSSDLGINYDFDELVPAGVSGLSTSTPTTTASRSLAKPPSLAPPSPSQAPMTWGPSPPSSPPPTAPAPTTSPTSDPAPTSSPRPSPPVSSRAPTPWAPSAAQPSASSAPASTSSAASSSPPRSGHQLQLRRAGPRRHLRLRLRRRQQQRRQGAWRSPHPRTSPVTLTGTDDLGAISPIVTTTDSTGAYDFTNLRPGTYIITETQPTGFLQGTNAVGTVGGTPVGSSAPASTSSATSSSPLASLGINYNFGELVPAGISGFVYVDANNNGIKEPGEAPIPGTTVTLTGTNDLGAITPIVTTTDSTGAYDFTNLRPGTYIITETQPTNYLQGTNAVGTVDGTAVGQLGPGVDVISNVVLASSSLGINYNFGEVLPSSIAGFVYVDANNNGVKDPGEAPIPGTTLTLTGTNDLGAISPIIITTDSTGAYDFTSLRPGTYTVTETQPAGFLQGTNAVGTVNGVATASSAPASTSSATSSSGRRFSLTVMRASTTTSASWSPPASPASSTSTPTTTASGSLAKPPSPALPSPSQAPTTRGPSPPSSPPPTPPVPTTLQASGPVLTPSPKRSLPASSRASTRSARSTAQPLASSAPASTSSAASSSPQAIWASTTTSASGCPWDHCRYPSAESCSAIAVTTEYRITARPGSLG